MTRRAHPPMGDGGDSIEPPSDEATTAYVRGGISRRHALGLAGAAVGVGALGFGAGVATSSLQSTSAQTVYPFYGKHQAGIITPVQDRLHFAAFDTASTLDRAGLITLLSEWTQAAARMTTGVSAAGPRTPSSGPEDAPPDDTGEALDLHPAGLTITFGFGPPLFTSADGIDRFGIASRRPAPLIDLPRFAGDALQSENSGGDLCIQACSDDPQVAVHAIRNLSRIAFGRAAIRWSQLGFGRTSSTSRSQVTPRNLFGFKDGTANITAEDTRALAQQVWATDNDHTWMAGGSYLVARKIRMTIETWDRQQLGEQQRIIGRTKTEGAPLSGGTEFSSPDFLALSPTGETAIDPSSHMRLAHPSVNSGAQLLRRGYNFVDGNDELGRLNAGLFFLAYQRDPRTQFVPIQQRLSRGDALNEYIHHVGSAVFAIPPGARPGSFVGAGLFA